MIKELLKDTLDCLECSRDDRIARFLTVARKWHESGPLIKRPVNISTLGCVRRHLGTAAAAISSNGMDRFSRNLLAISPELEWTVGYENEELDEGFKENFCFAEIVGTKGLLYSESFAFGVTLMAPNTFYPWHFHPAEEAYVTLCSFSEWGGLSGVLQPRRFGDVIIHDRNEPHAMKSSASVFLAPWIWIGDIHTAGRMCSAPR